MKPFEILAYEETSLGPLCLRRRRTLREPVRTVTEITLNHEFLMSSLHTDSERALAEIALGRLAGQGVVPSPDDDSGWRVLVGGLGLGFTAAAALRSPGVTRVDVVEFLPPVIDWLRSGLVPLSDELNQESRLRVHPGDIYQRLLEPPREAPYHAVLIDVDHSPDDRLGDANGEFYSVEGLRRAADHLVPGGVLAVWSYDESTPLLRHLREVYVDVESRPVRYHNLHVGEDFTDWLYLGTRAPQEA